MTASGQYECNMSLCRYEHFTVYVASPKKLLSENNIDVYQNAYKYICVSLENSKL